MVDAPLVPAMEAGAIPPRRLRPRVAGRVAGAVGVGITSVVVLMAAFAGPLAPYDPFQPVGASLSPPSAAHPMGTDALGRDLLSGVLHGARTSLLVAGVAGVMVMGIGMAVGTVSGFRGGLVDDLLMRFTEIFQTLPRFFLAAVVIALFGPDVVHLVLVLGLTSWALLARVVRSEVLSLRNRDFVEAARATGTSNRRIVFREIMPNVLPTAVVYLGLLLAQIILLETSLGFLGLTDPSVISWGYLAGQAQRFLRVAWWLSLFPGLAIAISVLGLNLLGDALTEALGGRI
jgi:peptide/nickel transport system permease protein